MSDAASSSVPAPLTPWQRAWRVLAALLFGLLLWSGTASSAHGQHEEELAFLDLCLGVPAVVLIVWHRRAPVLVAVLTTLLSALSTVAIGPSFVALASLATRRRWREVGAVLLLGLGAGLVYDQLYPFVNEDLPWWVSVLIGALAYGICVAVGLYIGARRDLLASYRERAETAEREQAMRVARAKANERARIAREMHDVLAHRISLVAMHAGALADRQDLTRVETAETATVLRDNAHRALADLRDVLGVLRDTDGGEHSTRPQPTLADLDELVRDSTSAGTPVHLTVEIDDLATVPETTARNAFRILQESLTNARKHAPGEPVDVALSGAAGGRLVLRVRNAIPTGPSPEGPALPASGMGLTGLAERAQLGGGELTFGPTAQGSYVVRAWLPWAS